MSYTEGFPESSLLDLFLISSNGVSTGTSKTEISYDFQMSSRDIPLIVTFPGFTTDVADRIS